MRHLPTNYNFSLARSDKIVQINLYFMPNIYFFKESFICEILLQELNFINKMRKDMNLGCFVPGLECTVFLYFKLTLVQ